MAPQEVHHPGSGVLQALFSHPLVVHARTLMEPVKCRVQGAWWRHMGYFHPAGKNNPSISPSRFSYEINSGTAISGTIAGGYFSSIWQIFLRGAIVRLTRTFPWQLMCAVSRADGVCCHNFHVTFVPTVGQNIQLASWILSNGAGTVV